LNQTCMPLAHVLRNQLKADLVSLFIHRPGGLAGQAVLSGSFNVVRWDLAGHSISYAFAHETAHNFGAWHEAGQPPTVPTYCHAYVYTQGPPIGWFQTIMGNTPRVRIRYYSNPNVSYLGIPIGIANVSDNARCISNRSGIPATKRLSDCNLNGVCDAQDIAAQTSQDCDGNGIPDECSMNGSKNPCCLNGMCLETTELCCLYQGGVFEPAYYPSFHSCGQYGEDCNNNETDDVCESPKLCCLSPNCWVIPEDCCLARGGIVKHTGNRCGADANANTIPDGCEAGFLDPLGACCQAAISCQVMLQSTCSSLGGTFGGKGTYCEDCNGNGWPAPCEALTTREYGACCLDGGCDVTTECSCEGDFLGAGSSCFDCEQSNGPQQGP
jgi:hypothetical protein